MGLHVNRIRLSLVAQVPEALYERHVAASPYIVGEELTEQITAYVREHKLGYYPAVDFFMTQGGLEKELLDAAEGLAWVTAKAVREEIQRKLRPVFSTVTFQSQQCVAFTMPAVRPNNINAYNELLKHYTPDTIKAVIEVTSFQKQDKGELMARWATNTCYRWLKDSFDYFEVTSSEVIA